MELAHSDHHIIIARHRGTYIIDPPILQVEVGDTLIIETKPPGEDVTVFVPESIFAWHAPEDDAKSEQIVPLGEELTVKDVAPQDDGGVAYQLFVYSKKDGAFVGLSGHGAWSNSSGPVIIIMR